MSEPYYADGRVTLYLGDCLDVLRQLDDASVDAVVTDPPYGLEFMGKEWDAPWKAEARAASATIVEADAIGGFQDGNGGNAFSRSRVRTNTQRHGGDVNTANRGFQEWCQDWATECLRVLKPGGHLLAFGGTRTWHRLACAIEDAGFEVRDSIAWLYGSGFPKSLDVSKAIDKLDATADRLSRAREFQTWLSQHLTPQQVNEATGTDMGHHLTTHPTQPSVATADLFDMLRPSLPEVPERIERLVAERTVESQNFKSREVVGTARMVDTQRSRLGFAGETYGGDSSERDVNLTAPATDDARTWQGWGTALKPAHEPIVVARKPLGGTVELTCPECDGAGEIYWNDSHNNDPEADSERPCVPCGGTGMFEHRVGPTVAGNVLAHGTGALNIDACRIGTSGATRKIAGEVRDDSVTAYGDGLNGGSGERDLPFGRWPANVVLDDIQAAALDGMSGDRRSAGDYPSAAESEGMFGDRVQGALYGDTGGASRFFYTAKAPGTERVKLNGTAHPTVKPLDLMRWLVSLVTPPNGIVLEPFAGSGTTVEACLLEGFRCVAIEREPDYLPLIMQRIHRRIDPVAAVKATQHDGGLFDLLDEDTA